MLYIGGCQRSGSTLLDRLVGQVEGYLSTGEIVHLWARGLKANDRCGCGIPFRECPFWSQVGDEAFGGWSQIDIDDVLELQEKVDRNRYILSMLVPGLAGRYSSDLDRYAAILDRLYRAIHRVGGNRVIVDSSKHASTAFLLRRVPSVRLRVVHLIRDSRGVSYSLMKRIPRPEVLGSDQFMYSARPGRSALHWVAFNGLFHVLRWVGVPTRRIRYEGLVSHPGSTIAGLVQPGSPIPDEPSFIRGHDVVLGDDHTVAGNPMRFYRGSLELQADEAWRGSMRPRDRRITTLFTWPMLAAYGYRMRIR